MKLLLFDIDGTLTDPRQPMTMDMEEFLMEIKKNNNVELGIVGGSDFIKAHEQIGKNIFNIFKYVFSENGLVFYKNGELIHKKSLRDYFSQSQINNFINKTLKILSKIELPVKTGTFIEYRNGMLNISPIGRACSKEERDEFEKLDNIHKYRENMIDQLKILFPEMKLQYSIGGQISFDVFPVGMNKTFCLDYIENKEIYFFGDKTHCGGNDYEIYNDSRTKGFHVNNYTETKKYVSELIK